MNEKERDFRDYLQDILASMLEIESFTRGMGADAFLKDRKTINAVVRSLEVIGEAAKKIPEGVRKKHPEVPWKRMAGMRDKLIHEYFGVDEDMVWKVATEELPPLKPALERIVKEYK